MYDQLPKSKIKFSSPSETIHSGCEEFESDVIEESSISQYLREDRIHSNTEIEVAKSIVTLSNNSTISSIDTTKSFNMSREQNSEYTPNSDQSSFVFQFEKLTGELGPNEKCCLKLSFCPLKREMYTVHAKCYLICKDFPDILNILPVVLKGSGCKTQLEVRATSCISISNE